MNFQLGIWDIGPVKIREEFKKQKGKAKKQKANKEKKNKTMKIVRRQVGKLKQKREVNDV